MVLSKIRPFLINQFKRFKKQPPIRILKTLGLLTAIILLLGLMVNKYRTLTTPPRILSPLADKYRQILPELERKAKANPRDYNILKQYADALYYTGSQDDALQAYKKTSTLNPMDAQSLNRIGNLHRIAKQYDQARQAYQESIAQDSNQINAYVNLAHLYVYDLHNQDQGFTVFQDLSKRHPTNLDIVVMMAKTYQQIGRKDKAKELYNDILKKDPKNPSAQAALKNL